MLIRYSLLLNLELDLVYESIIEYFPHSTNAFYNNKSLKWYMSGFPNIIQKFIH